MGYAEVVRRLVEANAALSDALRGTQSAGDQKMFSQIMGAQAVIRSIAEDCFVRGAYAITEGNNDKVI